MPKNSIGQRTVYEEISENHKPYEFVTYIITNQSFLFYLSKINLLRTQSVFLHTKIYIMIECEAAKPKLSDLWVNLKIKSGIKFPPKNSWITRYQPFPICIEITEDTKVVLQNSVFLVNN